MRTKNSREHLVHLSPLAIDILNALPRVGRRGYVFSTGRRGDTPVSGWSHAAERLAVAMVELRRQDLAKAGPDQQEVSSIIQHFTRHDLRRTAATGMAAIGVAPHVVDKILNHTTGKISGVAAIYNRFEYLPERKAALEAWSRHVESHWPTPSNVVELPRRAEV